MGTQPIPKESIVELPKPLIIDSNKTYMTQPTLKESLVESPKPLIIEINKNNTTQLTPKESPVEVSQTGRRMRDCRKFIHYEFSPPFASSESSVSEVDSVEFVSETIPVKKFTKKRGR